VEDAAFRWTIDPHQLKDDAAKQLSVRPARPLVIDSPEQVAIAIRQSLA